MFTVSSSTCWLCFRGGLTHWPDPDSYILFGVFQEWGQPGDLHNLGIQWHVPTAEEKSFATELLQEFLVSEFDAVQQHISGAKTLTRWDWDRQTDIWTMTPRYCIRLSYDLSVWVSLSSSVSVCVPVCLPITVLVYNGPFLCGFNMPVKWSTELSLCYYYSGAQR